MKKLAILLLTSTISIAGFSQTQANRAADNQTRVKVDDMSAIGATASATATTTTDNKDVVNDLEKKNKAAIADIKNDASLTPEQKEVKLKVLSAEYEKEKAKHTTVQSARVKDEKN
jgi:hypothetical protein